ncbi:hypothetical protein R83H12_01789 [Fibrobacteria bacterium R8-3-H12]
MRSKFFLTEPTPEAYIPMDFPYIEKEVDWVTPAIEIFQNEWKNTEYAKKYGINNNKRN